MKIMLENYGAYISHVESLSQTDSRALKRAELKDYLLKLKDASILISLAIYLDVPLKRLSLSFQQELHDPVKAVRRIQDFNLAMVKLKLLVDESLENPDSVMTNLKNLFQDVEKKENSYFFQGIKLARYEAAKRSVSNHYEFTVASIIDSMQNRFEELSSSSLFKNLVSLLDVSSWPKELSDFGSAEIESLKTHFSQLLSNNGCDIGEIPREWMTLKTYVIPIRKNSPKVKYLDIWERVFSLLKNAKMSFTSSRYFSLRPF